MSAAERARTAVRVAQIPAGVGAAAGWAAWMKGVAVAAGLGAAGLAAHGLAGDPPAVAPLERLPAERLRAPAPGEPAPAPEIAPGTPSAPAPEIAPGSPAPPPPEATPRGARGRPARDAPPAGAAPPAEDADALLREAELLEQARAGVARDPAGSLRSLDDHRDGFPDGQLTAEREILAIDALVRLGRADEARARARSFLARFPSSPYAERARRIAGTNP